MNIFINNQKTEVRAEQSLQDLLTEMHMNASRGIAIAINNEVVPKTAWQSQFLRESDKVTIIKATQGG